MPVTEPTVIKETEYVFTDRIQEQAAFNKLYNNLKKNEYEVINYWGIPGIGKSYLGQRLQGEVLRRGGNHSFIKIDFHKNLKDFYECLEDMAKELAEERNYVFPLFSIALSVYYFKRIGKKKSVDTIEDTFKNQHPFLFKLIKPAIASAGVVPVLNSINEFVSAVADSYGKEIRKLVINHKRELLRIEKYDLTILEKKLPQYFSFDYNLNVCKEKSPIVFFLDTYEQYVNELACIGYEYANDQWLKNEQYGLVPRCNNTLWVIMGREKIKWEELDPFWKGKIHTYELEDFSDDFARDYLHEKGIDNPIIVRRILMAAKGVPFHLYLSVEFYYQQIKKGIEPDEINFGRDYEDIFVKYIQYMNDAEKTIVFLMSCIGKWTKDDFLQSNVWGLECNLLTLERIHNLSFIKAAGNGEYYLHAEAEDILRKKCPEAIKQLYNQYIENKINRLSLSYNEKVLYISNIIRNELTPMYISFNKTINNQEITCMDRNVVVLERSFSNNRTFLEEYLVKKEYAHFETVISLYMQVINNIDKPTEEEKKVFIEILKLVLVYYISREWAQNTVDTEELLIKFMSDTISCTTEEIMLEKYRKISMKIAVPHNNHILDEIKSLYNLSKSELGEEHDITNGLQVLLEYETMVYSQRYEIEVVKRFVAEEKRFYGEDSPRGIKSQINLAYVYKLHQQYDKAISEGENLLNKMDCWFEEYDVDYMHAIDNLSIAYLAYGNFKRNKGNIQEAESLYKKGMELAKRVYSISQKKGQLDIMDNKDHLGYICRVVQSMGALKNYDDGERYCLEALDNPLFKNADKEMKEIIYDAMACIYMINREWRCAALYVKKVYEICCLRLGPKAIESRRLHERWKELMDISRKEEI